MCKSKEPEGKAHDPSSTPPKRKVENEMWMMPVKIGSLPAAPFPRIVLSPAVYLLRK